LQSAPLLRSTASTYNYAFFIFSSFDCFDNRSLYINEKQQIRSRGWVHWWKIYQREEWREFANVGSANILEEKERWRGIDSKIKKKGGEIK
jgi:hypothetical protein